MGARDQLWSVVTEGPAVCRSPVSICLRELFGKPKINHLSMASLVDHDILWLQVSVDYSHGVQGLQRHDDLSTVVLNPVPALETALA